MPKGMLPLGADSIHMKSDMLNHLMDDKDMNNLPMNKDL